MDELAQLRVERELAAARARHERDEQIIMGQFMELQRLRARVAELEAELDRLAE